MVQPGDTLALSERLTHVLLLNKSGMTAVPARLKTVAPLLGVRETRRIRAWPRRVWSPWRRATSRTT